jgi:DNA helicase INO80
VVSVTDPYGLILGFLGWKAAMCNCHMFGSVCLNSETMKQKAKKNVRDAFQAEQTRTREFAHGVARELTDDFKLTETSISADEERPQPSIFRGNLKHYQLKGMNWLANLYDQVCYLG